MPTRRLGSPCERDPHPLLPRLKRVRRTGRESRGRDHREDGPGRRGRAGSEEPVRRPRRRRAPLLEAARAPVPGAGRDPRTALTSRLHVEERPGRAPAVVLLHHGANTLRAWDEWIPAIAGGRRIVAYDRRGMGGSPRDAIWDAGLFHRDADDLAALLRALEAAPAHLVGHSDGATVALLTAARHPDVVASATWIAGHTHLEEPLRRMLLESGPADWPSALLDE